MLAITPSGRASRLPARPGREKGARSRHRHQHQVHTVPPSVPGPGGGSAGPRPDSIVGLQPPVPGSCRPPVPNPTRGLGPCIAIGAPHSGKTVQPARGGPRRVPASAARARCLHGKNVGLFFSEYAPGTRHND